MMPKFLSSIPVSDTLLFYHIGPKLRFELAVVGKLEPDVLSNSSIIAATAGPEQLQWFDRRIHEPDA